MNCSPGFFVDDEDMKKSLILISAIFCACFLTTDYALGKTASGDEPISLTVEQRPLGEVLSMITKMTGHAFIIDDELLDMPVTISVKAAPLHKALKSIFTDISNAIIYQSDGKIKIMVYSETAEKNKGSASQPAASPPEAASAPAAEQGSESSQEAAAEPETENADDTAIEEGTQSAEEQESADEQEPAEEHTENPDGETAAEQGETETTQEATN